MMTGEALRTRQWLQRRWHVVVPDDWLEACLEWIHQENQSTCLTANDLNNMVYEQWLLSDLREIGSHSLPAGAALQQKTELNGHFCLQVDSIIDVSSPYYSQLQKMTGTENANVHVTATQATQPSWEAKSSRMLMMKLTDGTQDIQGMEYQTIPCLSTSLTPGTKIRVSGHILCRLGVMMLTRDNVTLLGGEVESLLEDNTQLKLLQTALGQNSELGQNPPKEEVTEFKRENRASVVNESRRPIQQNVRQPVHHRVNTNHQAPPPRQPNNNLQHQIQGQMEFSDDDDSNFLDQMDTAQLDAMEEQWEDDVDYDAIMEQMDQPCAVKSPPSADSRLQARNHQTLGPSQTIVPPSRYGQQQSVSIFGGVPPCKRPCISGQASSNDIQSKGTVVKQPPASVLTTKQSGVSLGAQRLNENKLKHCNVKEDCQSANNPRIRSSQQQRLDSFVSRTVKSEPLDYGDQMGGTQTTVQNLNSGIRTGSIQVKKCKGESSPKPMSTHIKTEVKHEEELFDDMDFVNFTDGMDPEENLSVPGHGDLIHPSNTNLSPNSRMLSSSELVNRYLKGTLVRKRHDCTMNLNAQPYTYLFHVMKSWPPPVLQTVRVKAYISTLMGRLENNEGKEWSLRAKINDGSAAMEVDLGDEMLSTLIGFTAPECLKMKALARTDRSLKSKIGEGIKHCQQSLIGLSCILELELTPVRTRPYVKQHFNLRPEDLSTLKNRVING